MGRPGLIGGRLVPQALALGLAFLMIGAAPAPRQIAARPRSTIANKSTVRNGPRFDQDRAWSDLLKQVSFGPRVPGTEAQIKCRDWLVENLKKSCDAVATQEFTHVWSKDHETKHMWNVLGYQNWAHATERVVLIAHWDSRAEADQESDPVKAAQPIPGANDGASAVAILTELARVMKDAKPQVGVCYMLSDGEDLGPGEEEMYLGAIEFAKHLPEPKPNYGILLDMLGKKNLHVPVEQNSQTIDGKLVSALYNMAEQLGLSETFPFTVKWAIDDDHLPIWNIGHLKTIDLIDFDYQPYWHTLDDTPDKCSPDSLGKVGKLMQAWLSQSPPYRD